MPASNIANVPSSIPLLDLFSVNKNDNRPTLDKGSNKKTGGIYFFKVEPVHPSTSSNVSDPEEIAVS